uniref:Uncharacterized protein n=1 Tax=Solanum lycopersicum TaxID=4081 RepID=A0A3Q7GID9_SOLLC
MERIQLTQRYEKNIIQEEFGVIIV